jgi:MAP/microtubule affinity-regulating kinase
VFNQKFEHIRLFTPEGVEMFSEDLKFLKNGTLLYVSDHQDFD